MRTIKIWILGFRAGFEAGKLFNSGLTWADMQKNNLYDKGVNWGQKFARVFNR